MDAKLKQQWIEALRSGKYEQTKEALHSGDGYCCLGVLCDISRLGSWEGENYEVPDDLGELRTLKGELEFLRESFGIGNDQERTLIRMNDDDGLNFDAIADYIERAI